VQLQPVRVTVGAEVHTAAWAPLLVSSRLAKHDVAARKPPFRSSASLPPPAYRFGPGKLAGLLPLAAALLAAVGIALVALEGRRLVLRRRRAATATPLETALRYAREAAARPDPADRRKALELLAETVREGSISGTAWAEDAPSPERTLAIAAEVEEEAR
jgi:hypothetical protein